MSDQACVVHRLDLEDLERSVTSPALTALVRDGWRPMTSFAGEFPPGSGKASLFLVLMPPEKVVAAPLVLPPRKLLTAEQFAVLLLFGCAVSVPGLIALVLTLRSW